MAKSRDALFGVNRLARYMHVREGTIRDAELLVTVRAQIGVVVWTDPVTAAIKLPLAI